LPRPLRAASAWVRCRGRNLAALKHQLARAAFVRGPGIREQNRLEQRRLQNCLGGRRGAGDDGFKRAQPVCRDISQGTRHAMIDPDAAVRIRAICLGIPPGSYLI
jgi:hypothetical protein